MRKVILLFAAVGMMAACTSDEQIQPETQAIQPVNELTEAGDWDCQPCQEMSNGDCMRECTTDSGDIVWEPCARGACD